MKYNSSNLPLDPAQYNVFMLYTGYAESGALSPLVVSMQRDKLNFKVADSWKDAWETAFASFREVFLAALKIQTGFLDADLELPLCCQVAKTPFCATCGTNLRELQSKHFPEDEDERSDLALEMLGQMCSSTNDSFGYDVWELADERGWYVPGYFHESGVVTVINSHVETLLVNYDLCKESHMWDKEEQFWNNGEVSFFRYGPT